MAIPKVVAENTASSSGWRNDSFIGTLHETHHWNCDKYAKLEAAWLGLINADHDLSTDDAAFEIFDYLMLLFCCHFDPSDGFKFANLSADQVYAYRDRVRSIFVAYFGRDASRLATPETTIDQNGG